MRPKISTDTTWNLVVKLRPDLTRVDPRPGQPDPRGSTWPVDNCALSFRQSSGYTISAPILPHTAPPYYRAEYSNAMNMSVCTRTYLRNDMSPNFLPLLPRLSPPVAALHYVMYFRFCTTVWDKKQTDKQSDGQNSTASMQCRSARVRNELDKSAIAFLQFTLTVIS